MRDDEFTNSKSNNESFIAKSEFGNLPDSEFSDSGEMHMHKAAYDPSLMKSNSNSGNTKTVEDVAQSSSTAVESTVAGSGAATSIAATSAGVLTVASTVAIGALSVFAVISNMTHDYQVVLDSVRVIDDSMTYLVSVYDRNMSEKDYDDYFRERYKDADQGASMSEEEMEYPFVVKLYNASYSSSMHADYLSNEGVFQHITIGDTYTIEVSED